MSEPVSRHPVPVAPESGGDLGTQRSGVPAGLALLAAAVGAVAFVWAYATDAGAWWLGGSLTLAFGGLGYALAYWGRNLVVDAPAAEDYPFPPRDEEAGAELARDLEADVRIFTRRGFLTALLVGAGGLVALSQVALIGSLGPRPRKQLATTAWAANTPLVTPDGTRIKSGALASGGFLVAYPEGHTEAADSQVVLLRLPVDEIKPQVGREGWSPEGFVAYSRVCTHAGCVVAQYEDEKQVLVCPCHQSVFDVRDGARPTSGPAGRALPQLPLAINDAGYVVAQGDFEEPVGPGYWDLP